MPASPDISLERCPRCGASVAERARSGFCSQCLAAVSLAESEAAPALENELAAVLPRTALTTGTRTRFGDYELLEEIARGGMGVVYRARQRSLHRIVAIKTLLFGGFAGAEGLRRFRLEATSASALEHPNIVRILDVGEQDGQPFLAMDYVAGRDLARLVSERPLLARQAAGYVEKIARAVEFAHQRGVLHRDLKSSNVLIDAFDEPRVTDFGLAKRVESGTKRGMGEREKGGADGASPVRGHPRPSDSPSPVGRERVAEGWVREHGEWRGAWGEGERLAASKSEIGNPKSEMNLTRTGQPLGSPGFMPPEQAEGDGRRIGPASDVYGLGAILYHLLTSRPPFLADTFEATLRQVLDRDPIPPRQFNPNVPADLETICLKCLEKEPAKRYATARELAEELDRFLHDEPIHARPVGRVEKAWRWCRRKPALAGSVLLILLLLLLITIGSPLAAYRINRERQRAEEQATRAEASAANERRERYYASIAAADSHIRNGDLDVALSVLTNCPPEFRHWEWGRLMYLCHQSVSAAQLPGNNLESIVVSADGTRAVAARFVFGAVARVPCWEVGTRRELFDVASATETVVAMTFSPDGKKLAVALLNGLVKVVNAENGDEQSRFVATNQVHSLLFNEQETKLAIALAEGSGVLVDTMTGQPLLSTPDVGARFRAGALDPNGRFWVTMDDESVIAIRDASSGRVRFSFPGHTDSNPATYWKKPTLVLSPDGRRLVAHVKAQSAKVWNLENGEELLFVPSRVQSAAFHPDGRRVAILSGAKAVEIWDLASGERVQTLHGHKERVCFAGFDADGGRIRTASTDGHVMTWRAQSGRELIPHPYFVDAVAWSPDGARLLTSQFDGLAKIWDTASGRELRTLRGNWSWLRSAQFSADGKRIVTGGGDKLARILDADTGRELALMRGHTGAIRIAAFSPDGRQVATASRDKTARIWDAQSGRELHRLTAHSNVLRALAFSPDGTKLVTAAGEAVAHVWDVATGQRHFTLEAPTSSFGRIAFSRDGNYLATASMGRSVRIWDAKSYKSLAAWRARAGILALDFSPDGKRLLVVASDATSEFVPPSLEIWDVETGRQTLVLAEESSIVLGARFSPDGRRIATSSFARAARLWETFPWEERAYPDAPTSIENRSSRREEAQTSNSQRIDQSLVTSAATPLNRIQAYAAEYWRNRLAAEDQARMAGSQSAPVEPLRFPKSAWPTREVSATQNQIDLSSHYNALLDFPWDLVTHEAYFDNDLANLPTGTLTLANVTFDVRGLIRLNAATNANLRGAISIAFPQIVQGIRVAASCKRIQVLHGTEDSVPAGTVLYRIVLRYADESQREVPVLYGRDVRQWWEMDNDVNPESDRGIIAWRGTNPAVAERGGRLRLYLTTFGNPRPEAEVTSIYLISSQTRAAPFVIAITIE
jgi:WD40 repeat protein/serine/threonine protein kinase